MNGNDDPFKYREEQLLSNYRRMRCDHCGHDEPKNPNDINEVRKNNPARYKDYCINYTTYYTLMINILETVVKLNDPLKKELSVIASELAKFSTKMEMNKYYLKVPPNITWEEITKD